MRRGIPSFQVFLASALLCAGPTLAKSRVDGFSPYPRRAPPEDRQAVLDGNLAFALDLDGQLRREPGNRVFSPLSVSAVVAMLAAGAQGETREQLASTLHLDLTAGALDRAMQSVLAGLGPGAGSTVQLDVANGLWTDRRLPVRRGFVRSLRSRYGALAGSLDFALDPEVAREEINRWGSRMTHDLIPEVLHPGAVDSQTAFIVANAVYFGGKWAEPFLLDTTQTYPFARAEGSEVDIPLMHVRGTFGALMRPGFVAVDFPYEGEEYSMTILVPETPDGLPVLEQAMTPSTFAGWVENLSPEYLMVFLPRFEITSDLDLIEPMLSLGATDAFDPDRADFSGVAGSPGDIYLYLLRQQARIRVTEEGTEAAAVTVGGGLAFSFEPTPLVVDRPFLFVLRHRPTGTILFLGRVEDPSQ